jgi:stalled ribosome rescue protein Dom34
MKLADRPIWATRRSSFGKTPYYWQPVQRLQTILLPIPTKETMSLNNAVVWLDHTKAVVIHFDKDASESESLKTHSTHAHPRQNHADTHANEDDNTQFFNDIANTLTDSQQILVVGPAEEKAVFMKHLTSKVPAVAQKVKAVETVDHPSDGQLLSFARKYFVSAGGMQ